MKYSCIIAEDEELLLQNIVKKVEQSDAGFSVVGTAQTGFQAYELIEKTNPDLVISDIRMPVMDGIALLKKIREQFPQMDFIITSGYSDFEYAKSAIRYQATEYLLKPIDPEELNAALHKLKTKYMLNQSSFEDIFNQNTASHSPTQIAHILKEYLVRHYAEDINLNLIAYNMNYSSSYLTKLFVARYESSPSKYLIHLRIQKAQHLLLHKPTLSVKQVGEAVGYHDQAYFSRISKKYCKMSPAEYREAGEHPVS